jgi:hypothetical protein
MTLRIVPITFRQACAYIAAHHRHHKPPRGAKVVVGVRDGSGLVGVATVGRPNARAFDRSPLFGDIGVELTAEVTRTCTAGAENANSKLYGACRQLAKAMGYDRVITYTEKGESGASLKAAGFVKVKDLPARRNWANSSRKLKQIRDTSAREDVPRVLWEIRFRQEHTE